MATSEARRIANQKNSLKSTGPRTEQGKARSRRNGLKHGLAGIGVVLPDDLAAALQRRATEWTDLFQPRTAYEAWLVRRIALAAVRLDRLMLVEEAQRHEPAGWTVPGWDEDRPPSPEELGDRLPLNPALIARHLRLTTEGRDWLIARWQELVRILDQEGGWDHAQLSLAFDLQGLPLDLRAHDTLMTSKTPVETLRALAIAEISELGFLQTEGLVAREARQHRLAEAGLDLDTLPAPDTVHRYELECERELRRALRLLARQRRDLGSWLPTAPASPKLAR